MRFSVQVVCPLLSEHDEDIAELGTDKENCHGGCHWQIFQDIQILLGKGPHCFTEICL